MAGSVIDLRPTICNLLLYAGDGFTIKLQCKDLAGAPVDINGAVEAEVRLDRINPVASPLANFAVSLVDAYLGIIALSLTGVQTQALVVSGGESFTGVWDVQWTPTGKQPHTLVQGVVECVADVTR